MEASQISYYKDYVPAIVENTALELIYELSALLGYSEVKHTPRVEVVQFIIIPVWIGFGFILFVYFVASMLVWFNFNFYIALSAMENWGWIETNIFDDIFGWFWKEIDSNYVIGFMVWPTKQLMGVFLDLDDKNHFNPLNEWQAYFFATLMYPYIYFISLSINIMQLNTIPIMLFWYLVDPYIFIKGVRSNGTNIPEDNYAMIYAESDAINAILYGDMRYLYYGREAFTISTVNFIVHWVTNVVILVLSPIMVPFMLMWMGISAFQVCVLYLYSLIIVRPREEQQEAVDLYY